MVASEQDTGVALQEWAAYLKAPVAGTEAALGRKPTGEDNPFEWVITAVGPVRACGPSTMVHA